MEVQKRTTLQQWWEAGDTEKSAVKRVLFKGWAVFMGVVTSATGLGIVYHALDWWWCSEQNKKLQDRKPRVADPGEGLHVRSTLTAEAHAPAPAPSLTQRVETFRAMGETQDVAYRYLHLLASGTKCAKDLEFLKEKKPKESDAVSRILTAAADLVVETIDAEHGEKLRAEVNQAIDKLLENGGWLAKQDTVKQSLKNWAGWVNEPEFEPGVINDIRSSVAPDFLGTGPEAEKDQRFAEFLLTTHLDEVIGLMKQINTARANAKQVVRHEVYYLSRYEEFV